MALTPAGLPDPSLAIAASRAGGLGVLDLEYTRDQQVALNGVQKLAQHARNDFGIKVDSGDIELLAKRYVQFAQSPHLCQQMGIAGRERVESLYSFEKLGNNILNIYTEIAKVYKKKLLYNALLQRK